MRMGIKIGNRVKYWESSVTTRARDRDPLWAQTLPFDGGVGLM